jgi:2'-5' RNA ligase
MSEELISIYNKLYEDGIQKIKSDQYETDDLIGSSLDKRFGVTLLIRPDEHVRHRILKFLAALHAIEPEQYYYPSSDMHITVLPIISCHEEFDLNQIAVQDYIDLIRETLPSQQNIKINFKGITASPSCIMIQGFPQHPVLDELRNSLRTAFKTSSLQQDIDKRYAIRTAHATVVRFKNHFAAKEEFIKVLNDFKDYDFGTTTISELELVYNDWYMSEKIVKTLFRFKI